MYALMRTRLLWRWSGFCSRTPMSSLELSHHLSRSTVDIEVCRHLRAIIAIPRPSCFCRTVKSGSLRGLSRRVLVSCRQVMSKSWMSLSSISPRCWALAQFHEQILNCFFESLSAFVCTRLWPPRPPLLCPPLFPRCLFLPWDPEECLIACARSPLHWRDLGGRLQFMRHGCVTEGDSRSL